MRVVPTLDPFEDRHASLGLTLEASAAEQFALERGKEALRHGIVIGITDRTHRGHDARFATALAEGITGVLGDFQRSSQHLTKGGVVWDDHQGGLGRRQDGLQCGRRGGRASTSVR